jgi:nitroreductase
MADRFADPAGWPDVRIFDAIFGLRATRVYEDQPLPDEVLARILKAATLACSSGNTQPWEFVVVTDSAVKTRLQRMLAEAFAPIDRQRAQSADQLVDEAGRPVTGHAAIENVHRVGAIAFVFWSPDRGIRMQGEYQENPDGTLRETRDIPGGRGSSLYPACQNMMLAAQALGVSSLFTTFFGLVQPGVKELLHVPPRMFLEAAVFLGYGAEQLGKPRRKPLHEVVHLNDWEGRFEVSEEVPAP